MTLIPLIIYADHPVLRRRNAGNAGEHEAGVSGPDRSDRDPVGDRSGTRLRSGAGRARRTDIAEFSEQSQHHPVKAICSPQAADWGVRS